MKVTLLNDSFPPVIDGVANVVMNYAKILQEEKLADVMVATPAYPGAEYHSYPYWVVPYQSFDTTKIVKGYRAGNPLDIKEIVTMKEFAPDIIHSHCPVSSTLLARTLRFYTDAPLVFTYHTKFDIDIAKAVKSKLLQKGENLRCLGYTGEYRVVSNGVDFAKGRVAPEKVAKVTDSHDLPEGIPVFLFVGRIVKYKGLPLILDALAKLSQDGVDFRMVFVGSGPDEKEMKEKAASLLKPEQYIFTGAVYDREQLREAAACGLASVLIGGSCAAEGITDDRNGFLIEETPDAMYRLLKRVGSDLAHLYDVGEHAMNEIYISWEDSVHSAYERYGEIIEAKKSGKLVLRHNAISGSMKNMQEKVKDSIKVTEEFGEECRNSFKKEYEMAYDEFLKEYEKISRIFHMH